MTNEYSTKLQGAILILITLCFTQSVFAKQPPAQNDEAAIRSQADQFARAFAAGDAKAIGNMWAKDATFRDIDGRETRGRENIEHLYNTFFAANGRQPMEIAINSIRFPASNVAIEDGTTKSLDSMSKYTAVHVKNQGHWLMYSVTESPDTDAGTNSLKDLAWLVGDWTASNSKDKMHLNARWAADQKFILCTYQTGHPGEISEVQVIGWDPVKKRLFSSNFSTGGGFGQSMWTRDGKAYVLQACGVQPNGSGSASDNILRPVDKDSFTWQSTRRMLDGVPLPDTSQIRIVRDGTGK